MAVVVNRFRKAGAETREVHPAVRGVYVVDEGVRVFQKTVVVLKGYFDEDVVPPRLGVEYAVKQRRAVFINVFDEFFYAALVVVGFFVRRVVS